MENIFKSPYVVPGVKEIKTVEEYLKRACSTLQVTEEEIKIKTHKQEIVLLRAAIARGMIRKFKNDSIKYKDQPTLSRIGVLLGGLNHATIIHYQRRLKYHPVLSQYEKMLIKAGL